jgi:hypothetical protein
MRRSSSTRPINGYDLLEWMSLYQEADGKAYWLLRADAHGTARYSMADVIHFKYPDPGDPYGPGLSPLKATFERTSPRPVNTPPLDL